MKFSNQSRAVVLFSVLFLSVSSAFTLAISEEQVSNSPLNGKWEGRPPSGGELTMTLAVDKDKQIKGSGVIPGGGVKGAHPEVSGKVDGTHVTLETYFPSARPQSRVHYDCTLAGDSLQCRTKSGYKTTFKKVE